MARMTWPPGPRAWPTPGPRVDDGPGTLEESVLRVWMGVRDPEGCCEILKFFGIEKSEKTLVEMRNEVGSKEQTRKRRLLERVWAW